MSVKSVFISLASALVVAFLGWYVFFKETSTLKVDFVSVKTGKAESLEQLCAKAGNKPLFINFWATWCPICRKDLPALSNLARRHADVVFVSNDYNAQTVESYITDNNYEDLSMYTDLKGAASKVFGVVGLPTTVKLDKNCQIVGKHVGPLDAGTIALFFDVPLRDI